MDKLANKNLNYLSWIKDQQDPDGFIQYDECDSLIFSGLVGCVPSVHVNIDAAHDVNSGLWNRRPCYKPCFPEHSKSTISRDMILGLLWFSYYNKRLDISEGIIKHALNNYLIMGKAVDLKTTLGRCLLTPGLLSTAAWVSYRLGGPSRPWLRYIPQTESSTVTDFQAHLSVLHILLRNSLTGKNKYSNLLEKHYQRNPKNPLFCIATGKIEEAKLCLLDESLWPEDRLPTSRDRKEPWLLQREYGESWKPSNSANIHSGGDFLFCYWLINKPE